MFRNLVAKVSPMARSISTTSGRAAGHSIRGVIGSNLPFQVENRYRLVAVAILYFSSGFALPFLLLRRMILLKNQD